MPGRHRQTAARPAVAAAAVTGGLVITGSLTLPSAVAEADTSPPVDWNAVAACESTGNWAANTGNGFSGGLQFTDQTWRAFGGSTSHAYQAGQSEQKSVAQRVLAGQGIGAWPVCGPRGLGRHAASTGTGSPSGSSSTYTPTRHSRPSPSPNKHSAPTQNAPAGRTHRVLPGETLSGIAAQYGTPGGWPGLQALNQAAVPNPNLIVPGQVLRVA